MGDVAENGNVIGGQLCEHLSNKYPILIKLSALCLPIGDGVMCNSASDHVVAIVLNNRA